ncbi:putative receptor-like protein 12-like [Capsicum annuum]|nr:putative receptor-like protein 12-like [Capsicum annuum]
MGTEDKTLFCFCHLGWNTKVLPDGSTSYVGGITCQVIVKTGTKYHDLVNAVFERLCIDPSNIILHFTVKLDTSQLIELRDQEDVNTLLQFNDSFAHVYASSLEVKPYSMPPSGGAKEIDFFVVSDSKPDATPAGDDENVLGSPLKKARFQSAGDSKPQLRGVGLPEGEVQNDNSKIGTVNEQASGQPSGAAAKVEDIVYSDSETDATSDSNPPEDEYLYPDFSDFDQLRAENCFANDQIWACYDADDEMPRCYALIKNVSRPEFKIKLRWLEPNPEYPREQAWVRGLLPVGTGKFKCGRAGSIEYTSVLRLFSHQVSYLKGRKGPYLIYPRKGEIWALFKDWNIDWIDSPSNHREYKYEVVEILSDYEYGVGFLVGYLDKVSGFVSLFQSTKPTVVDTFFKKPNDDFRFSHRAPSFKMNGTEGEGVPEGSFELDIYALPINLDDIWYPGKVEEDSSTADSEPVENFWSAVPPGTRDVSRTPDDATTPLGSGNLRGIHAYR